MLSYNSLAIDVVVSTHFMIPFVTGSSRDWAAKGPWMLVSLL